MKYPFLSRSACAQLAGQKMEGADPSIDARVQWLGTGLSVDLAPLEEVADQLTDLVRRRGDESDRDALEGSMAGRLLDAVEDIPIQVLDDPGFWRYLSLALFWEFIAWREAKAFAKGNYLKYVECETSTEAVLTRMYLRANAVGGRAYYTLAAALPKATDFWRSHVIRVRTVTEPKVTRALVRAQMADRLSTESLRELARGVNRTWTNVVLYVYDESEAAALIAELRDAVLSPEQDS